MKTWSILLLMIFTGLLFNAVAGEIEELKRRGDFPGSDRFWLTPYAGVLFYGNLKPLPNTGFSGNLSRPSSFLIGIRLSRLVTQSLVIEATFTRSATENVHELLYYDLKLLERVPPAPPFGVQTLRNSINPVLRLGGNVLFRLPVRGPIVSHLSAGLGWVHHSPRKQVAASIAYFPSDGEDGTIYVDTTSVTEESVLVTDQNWLSVDLGAGFSGKMSQVLAVRVDVVLHVSKFSQLDVDGPLTGDVFYARPRWVNDLELGTGVIFRF